MTERARTIFLGSGSFAVPIAEVLPEHPSVELIAVVTAPTRKGSRGRSTDPPVAEWAAGRGLQMFRPARLRAPDALAELASLRPDLLVLADYGQILPAALIDLPPHGALNLHPSLLPRHRGASPIPAAILEGDEETGVSLMRMDQGLDTGPVIAQVRHPLNGMETAPALERVLAQMAAELLAGKLEPWLRWDLPAMPQAEDAANSTRLMKREDGRLDPSLPVARLERQVRAFQPWPGSFVETDGGRLTVWRASPAVDDASSPAGALVGLGDGRLGLVAADGVLELLEVQPAGGRRMSGGEYLRGRPELVGRAVLSPPQAPPRPSK